MVDEVWINEIEDDMRDDDEFEELCPICGGRIIDGQCQDCCEYIQED